MTRVMGARRLKVLSLVALVLLMAIASACGVKTAPYPEAATLPNKVQSLKQTITDEGELILSWKPPQTNMVGRPLKDIGGFVIEMSDNRISESYCEGCPHQYERVDQVPAATAPPGLDLAPGPYRWRYKLTEGHVYRFKVYGMSPGGGVHPDSAVTAVVWAVPSPGELGGFSAALGDKAVELAWGRPGRGYSAEIEKKTEDGAWKSVKGLDPAAGHFSDLDVDYEKTYTYRARLARLKDDSSRTGPWSREITVKVADITPPPPPGYLDAALAKGGVRLTWESVAFDPDLAGYKVYRQLEGEPGFTLISKGLVKENTFFDPISQRDGQTVRYQVIAVDKSPRANASQPSPAADVYLDPPAPEVPRP